MPIRPEMRVKYPPPHLWKLVRAHILNRAEDCCEFCGAPNREIIGRAPGSSKVWTRNIRDMPVSWRTTKIVLTIAHLDHNPENNAPKNLRALCQACHLWHDRHEHAKNARRTRMERDGIQEFAFRENERC